MLPARLFRFRALLGVLLLTAIALTLVARQGSIAAVKPRSWTHGVDLSWPQCHGARAVRMPEVAPSYAILGLTDGRGNTVNPCLVDQVGWAQARHVKIGAYLVPSYPTARELAAAGNGPFGQCSRQRKAFRLTCRLRNAGAEQASGALATMTAAGVTAPMVWIDVERRSRAPWHSTRSLNRAVIQGDVRALSRAHLRYGVYTTSLMWREIVGDYRLHVPNWLPSGSGRIAPTKRLCGRTATGGRTWMVQYWRHVDNDLICPSTKGRGRSMQVAR